MHRTALALASIAFLPLLPKSATAQSFERLRDQVPRPISHAAIADLDGAAGPDLVGVDEDLSFLINDGSARFERHVILADVVANQVQVSVADFLGSPLPDVLLWNDNLEHKLFENIGGSAFVEKSGALPAVPALLAHDFADIEGDGDLDILLTGGHANTIANVLLLNDGNGLFVDASGQLPILISEDAAFVDVDGDGDPDIFHQGDEDHLLRNNGAGVFTVDARAEVPDIPNQSNNLRFVDVDGDGSEDLIYSQFGLLPAGAPTAVCWFNDGTGSFPPFATFVATYTEKEVFFDWNDDGDLDFVSEPYREYTSGIFAAGLDGYLGKGGGQFQSVALPALKTREFLTIDGAADFDLDGDQDLLCNGFILYFNNGEGAFEQALVSPEDVGERYTRLEVADVDKDGSLDVVGIEVDSNTASIQEGGVSLLRNDGSGRFLPKEEIRLVRFSDELAVLDVEGDGQSEIIVGQDDELTVYRFDQATGWNVAPGVILPLAQAAGASTVDLEAGDLNGDGLEDLVAVFSAPGASPQNYLLINDGSGSYARSLLTPQALRDAQLGDVDGDGDLDAVCLWDGRGCFLGEELRTYLNPGNGLLADSGKKVDLVGPACAMKHELADMNADGVLDLVVLALSPSERFQIFLGDGTGTFGPLPAVVLPQTTPGNDIHFVLFDASGDGLPEIFGSGGTLYNHVAPLTLVDVTDTLDRIVAWNGGFAQPVAGDFDRDGDVDLMPGGRPYVLWNLEQQIAFRSWPRIGQSLWIDLWGKPGGTWVLWGSESLLMQSTKWGLAWLDYSRAFKAGAGALDASGRATMQFAIPADPALTGLVVYWQAALGKPFRLSPLETTSFSDS